jgi:hypothetical protein
VTGTDVLVLFDTHDVIAVEVVLDEVLGHLYRVTFTLGLGKQDHAKIW